MCDENFMSSQIRFSPLINNSLVGGVQYTCSV